MCNNLKTGDNLEGVSDITVSYDIKIEGKSNKYSQQELRQIYGDSLRQYFNYNGDYVNVNYGSFFTVQLFIKDSLKIYSRLGESDTLVFASTKKSKEEILSYKITEDYKVIDNQAIDLIELKTKSKEIRITYCKKYYLNPKNYINHKENNWGEIIALIQSIPLTINYETEDFILYYNAKDIQFIKIKQDGIFEIPESAILIPFE